MEFIDNSIILKEHECESKLTEYSEENSVKLVCLKRKIRSDSLDCLDEINDKNLSINETSKQSEASSPSSSSAKSLKFSSNLENFFNETGLNVEFIHKNDKKMVKLNVNNNINPIFNSTLLEKSSKGQINHKSSTSVLNDLDDLPSENMNGTIVIPINSPANIQSIKTNFKSIVLKNDSLIKAKQLIRFKCEKCFEEYDNESALRNHQNISHKTDTNTLINQTKLDLYSKLNTEDCNIKDSLSEQSNENKTDNKKISLKSKYKPPKICNECGMQVASQTLLNKHMLQAHHISKQSSKKLSNSNNVAQQQATIECSLRKNEMSCMKMQHENELSIHKPFRCQICFICSVVPFEFTRSSNLRSHILKVHPNDINTLVHMRSIDNQLKFEFDIEAINAYKEKLRFSKFNSSKRSNLKISLSQASSSPASNRVIIIKDPNNKNGDIQHMVIYVDGKPIFIENSKQKNSSTNAESTEKDNLIREHISLAKSLVKTPSQPVKLNNFTSSQHISNSAVNKPSVKIPYLLAAAASNQRKQKPQSSSLNKINSNECARSGCYMITNSNTALSKNATSNNKNNSIILNSTKTINPNQTDQEYDQLVSLLRQKNEKLYNPLLNKSS